MKAFRFRAERFLEWRRIQADAARVAFVRANESTREAAARLADAERGQERAGSDYCRALSVPIAAAHLERYRNWIVSRQGDVAAARDVHARRTVLRDKAADAMKLADRNERIVERLRERAWGRYLDAARRAEMKEYDALATLRFARRRAQGGSHRDR